ncbi:putative methyltransferase-domain-containing protein [Lipomyces kononenkoae]
MYHVRFLKVPYSKCLQHSVKSDSSKKSSTRANIGKPVTARKPNARIQSSSPSTCTISFVVTLTTDLGESFFYGNTALSVNLIASGQSSSKAVDVTHAKVQWKTGMRALPIELEVSVKKIERIMKNEGKDVRFYVHVEPSDENDIHLQSNDDPLPALLPITSLGFWFSGSEDPRPLKDAIQYAIKYDGANYRYVVRDIPIGTTTLKLLEETGESIARHLWDSGILLCNFLMSSRQNSDVFIGHLTGSSKKMNILELGSGCGTVGLTLSRLFRQSYVVLTDLDSARSVCERNIALNCSTTNGRIEFSTFNWDSSKNTEAENAKVFEAQWDLVIACDCTYNVDSFDILTDVLLKIVSQRTKLLLVHKERHGSEARVFDLLKEKNKLQSQWRKQLEPASSRSTADILVRIGS